MSEQNSIINFGDISKPATVLIEKVSDAIGGIFRPHQILRIANAEAEAERIKAVSRIEVNELQQRAVQRFIVEEARHQLNMEQITAGSLPLLSDDADPSKLDDDWVTNFFDKCRTMSDSDMQKLWSQVLAGEANNPGTFSRKTVNLLADFDKSSAESFSALSRFKCTLGGQSVPIVFDFANSFFNKAGIDSTACADLESLGLIRIGRPSGPTGGMGMLFLGPFEKEIELVYFGTTLRLTLKQDSGNAVQAGRVVFTKAGRELVSLCDSKPVDGFIDYLKATYRFWNQVDA